MAQPLPYQPAVFIAAVTAREERAYSNAVDALESLLGTVVARLGPIDFDSFTSYYAQEMGRGLRKWFLCFGHARPDSSLARIKLATNDIEHRLSSGEGRDVNIDPGMFDRYKLMLASCKNGPMRVPVGEGVYAEVTLQWIDGKYEPHRLTYADWASEEVRNWLAELRDEFEL
ncbi:MAG: DUF4416 family protein [Planctomycetota bacterium]|nr:DUF4416 family protein [Planctomycetota bacterium]